LLDISNRSLKNWRTASVIEGAVIIALLAASLFAR
jgi:hypothetical protein